MSAPAGTPGRGSTGPVGLLSLYWFAFFAAQGIFFPYYTLYLRENAGLSGTEVGFVLAALPFVGIFAQPLWGQISDRTGARARVLAVLTAAAGVGYATLALPSGFPALLLATAVVAVVASPVVPLAVAVSLAELGEEGAHAFGRVRVWDTVSFLVLVVGFPRFLDWLGAKSGVTAVAGYGLRCRG